MTTINKSRVEWLIYPSPNHWGEVLRYRDVEVEIIDEINYYDKKTPLPIENILLRRQIRRGGIMLAVTDLENYEYREFYREAAHGGRLPWWRLGLYHPSDPTQIEHHIRDFPSTARDWEDLIETIEEFEALQKENSGSLMIGAYPLAP